MTEPALATAPRTEICFHVKGSPLSQNAAWRIAQIQGKNGAPGRATLMLSTDGIKFKAEVARLVSMSKPRDWDRENQYIVDCIYFFDSLRPDVDGPGKLILDALGDFELRVNSRQRVNFTGFYKNDRQVWLFTQRREKDAANPRAEITIRLRHATRAPAPRQGALL